MTFPKIKIPAIVLGACLILFILKTYELRAIDREAAPALTELSRGGLRGIRAFQREYMADPYGKAAGLSGRELELCRNVSLLIPAYESAARWRSDALFFGICALAFIGIRKLTANPLYRTAVQACLRRMAAKAEPMMARARERAAGMAEPHAVHSIVTCPKCSRSLRLPSGKGRVRVTCPGCGASFESLT